MPNNPDEGEIVKGLLDDAEAALARSATVKAAARTVQRLRLSPCLQTFAKCTIGYVLRSRTIAAMTRGLRRPWITAITQSGLSSGA